MIRFKGKLSFVTLSLTIWTQLMNPSILFAQIPSEYKDEIFFHTPSHIARWNKSTLGGIDPHVVTAFVILMIILIPMTFWYRNQKTKGNIDRLNNIQTAINANDSVKEKMIVKKMDELEEKYSKGIVSDKDYEKAVKDYKTLLDKFREGSEKK